MRKSRLAVLAAGVATSVFIGGNIVAGQKCGAKSCSVKPPKKAAAKPVDKWAFLPNVVAQIGDKKVTKAEIIKLIDAQISKSPFAAMITPQMLQRIAPNFVKNYVEQQVLLKLAEAKGVKPSAQMVIKDFDENLKKAPKDKLAMFQKQLAAQNKTLDSYKKEMSKNKDIQNQIAIKTWVMKDIEPKVKVSEKDVTDFYNKNKAMFKMPEKLKASHILIMPKPKSKDAKEVEAAKKAAKAKTEKLLAEIKAGKISFEDAAAKESGCPSGKKKGSLGEFPRGKMVPAFDKAAFALKPGQMSGVVETNYGFHIIRCDGKTEKKQLTLNDNVQGQKVSKAIRQMLTGEKMQKLLKAELAKAKAKYKVKVFVKAPAMPRAPQLKK